MLTVADIFRRHVEEYLELFGDQVLPSHRRAIADIVACRTEAMGGVLRECDECGRHRTVFHSCRNRACPECHGKETIRWMAGRVEEMLPVTYPTFWGNGHISRVRDPGGPVTTPTECAETAETPRHTTIPIRP